MVDINGFEQYLYDEELSENTRDSYMFSIKNFAENFDTVSKQNIIAWKQLLLLEKSPKTVNLRLSARILVLMMIISSISFPEFPHFFLKPITI